MLVVVHAEHYDHAFANPNEILWNNFYEYQFTHSSEVASYIVATPTQKDILTKQFKKYYHITPRIDYIPVGHMPNSIRPQKRKPFSLITASRLAPEKHVDWVNHYNNHGFLFAKTYYLNNQPALKKIL